MDITKIDKNMKVKNNLNKPDAVYLDVRNYEEFDIYGLCEPKKHTEYFQRIPSELALSVSDGTDQKGVAELNYCPAGGRIRFSTDSDYIGISIDISGSNHPINLSKIGAVGLDLYVDMPFASKIAGTFAPPFEVVTHFDSVITMSHDENNKQMNSYTIVLPLFEQVKSLKIILQEGSVLEHGLKYKNIAPIVYYGSSITQGAAASRPGCTYEAIISNKYNWDYINLGFSGNAKGEPELMNYIASLDMSVFVYDYDHNAELDLLEKTHEKGFLTIRQKNENLPIVLISKPDFKPSLRHSSTESAFRRNVIYNTYINGLNNGDKNVYYIDGEQFFNFEYGDYCTADFCHPNTLGFVRMADTIGKLLNDIMNFNKIN